jgi:hypothetical protein
MEGGFEAADIQEANGVNTFNGMRENIKMIVGREQIIYFENLAKQQQRIYPDSADYGIECGSPLSSYCNGGVKKEVRENLMVLKKSFKIKVEKWDGGNSGYGSTTTFFIPYEREDGHYIGINLSVSHNVDRVYKKEFLAIDISRARTAESPWKED